LIRAQPIPWLIIALLFLLPRFAFVFAYPIAIGDASVYLEVARNILHNGCTSLSPSTGELCVPHWGGNQLPGYPAFIAGIWGIFGETNTAVRIVQVLLSSAALFYLAWTSAVWSKSRTVGLILGTVLALSPTTLGWPRHMFTESLAIAGAAFVFAEIIRSLAEKNLRVLPLGLGLAAAIFVRIDLLSLCVPVALAGLIIERPGKAIAKGLVIAAIIALPISAWTLRSVAAGLPIVPDLTITAKGERFPAGFMAWGKTWAVDQYQLGIWMYPMMHRRYAGIVPPPEAFDDAEQENLVRAMLHQLKTIEGQEMPIDIDAAFGKIARARIANNPMEQWLVLPLKRMLAIWVNPASSTGLPLSEEIIGPTDIEDASRQFKMLSREGFSEMINLIVKYPELLLYKGASLAERLIIALTAIALLVGAVIRRSPWSILLFGAASFAAVRLVAFAYLGVPSTRYIVEAIPPLEAAIIVSLLMWWKTHRHTTPPAFRHRFRFRLFKPKN